MGNTKTRPSQHIIGDKAVKFISNLLPDEWVIRQMSPDYGVDLDVELFDYEDGKCVSLGEHVFMQVKGTESPQIDRKKFNESYIYVIKYTLEVNELNLVERMGSALPVILIVVDLLNCKVYHLCLNDYIKKILLLQKSDYKKQRTITIYIPLKNEITNNNYHAIQWYGMRNKIYAMFHEMLTDVYDLEYSDDLHNDIKRFVEHYKTYDLLKRSDFWNGFKSIEELLSVFSENNYLYPSLTPSIIECFYNNNNFSEEYLMRSADFLIRSIKNYSGMFETYCREWYMPGLFLGCN